jgi:TolB protein
MFTPDGTRIVFQSPRDYPAADQVDLYVMKSDGGDLQRIVSAPGFDGVAVPSPDGKRIAFQRGTRNPAGEYQWDLYLIDADGRNERRLTSNAWSSQVPTWTHDSKGLVLYANPAGRDQLFRMDVATGAVSPLSPSAGNDTAPSLSPDGRYLVFNSTRDGARDLYRLALESGQVMRLTNGMDIWSQPSWSPDGRTILFSARQNGVQDIYRMNADGSGVTRITRGAEGMR